MKMLSRNYAGKPLTHEDIQERVFKIVKTYDKIAPEKVFQPFLMCIFFFFFPFISFITGCVESNRKSTAGNRMRNRTTRMWPSLDIIQPNNRSH